MFDYLIVGAGFAGSVVAAQMARKFGKKVCWWIAGITSAATLTIIMTMPVFWCTNTALIFSIPIREKCSNISRSSLNGANTSTGY